MRLPAKPYQNAIASAVQTMADRKNSFGRGKNETNIVCIQSQVSGFVVPLSDTAHAVSARSCRAGKAGLTIEPGKTVKLAPGGYHLMLLDLKSPLKRGDKVPVTLEFEKAGKVRLSFDVQGVGAQGPATAPSSGVRAIPVRQQRVGLRL
jgi:copper(I)-binding protein